MVGDSFEFLVVESGTCWKRAGRVQRVVGIKPEFFRRPEALLVPDRIMRQLAGLFEAAHPGFNYYGPTEFAGPSLHILTDGLESGWKARAEPDNLELGDTVRALAEKARLALGQGKSLLVLGI